MHPHYRYCRGDAGIAERLVPAIVLIGLGGFFLLNNLHIVFFREIFSWWPALLIAYGIVKLVDSSENSGRAFGGLVACTGGILLARNLGFLEVHIRELWPLVLIGAGVMTLFHRSGQKSGEGESPDDSTDDRLRESAVFSGGKRHITTQNFTGGKVDSVFGGFELDFRRAGIAGESADLKVDAVFGGVEIRIPPNWNAVVKGDAVFGAFSDESRHPEPGPDVKRLIVRGGAVFGGVVVKN